MSKKVYVIRQKLPKLSPTKIPESTYRTPSPRKFKKPDPIETPDFFLDLSQPKPNYEIDDTVEIPTYTNPPPIFDEVDYRVTYSQLQRDEFLINEKERRIKEEKAKEPTEFYAWKHEMEKKDEQGRVDLIKKRHMELDSCRKKAKKAKKTFIKKQLQEGNKIREDIRKQLEQAQFEIEMEKEEIKKLKSQITDNGAAAVAKIQEEKCKNAKEMKTKMDKDLKLLRRRINDDLKQKKEAVERAKEKERNHEETIRGKYKSNVSITDTKFLNSVSDEEAQNLIKNNKKERAEKIERLIEEHRKAKEAKIDRMIELLNKETEYREQLEREHENKRDMKKERERREKEIKDEEENRKMLILEKKLEKKRKMRIKEAEEMEEHMRTIKARNRYLALSKKAQEISSFQSKQDGNLRTAKERQDSMLKEKRTQLKTARRQKVSPELTNLKGMLGL